MSKKKFKCAKNGSNEQQTNCSNEQKNSSNEQKIVSYEPIKSCGHMTNNINDNNSIYYNKNILKINKIL